MNKNKGDHKISFKCWDWMTDWGYDREGKWGKRRLSKLIRAVRKKEIKRELFEQKGPH